MIKREAYLKCIRPFMNQDVVKVLTGIRRSGKSAMLALIEEELLLGGVKKKQCLCYNFENMQFRHFLDGESLYEELVARIRKIVGRVYLFLDEIQEVEHWEKCINSLRTKFDCDIYITSSNTKLFSSELTTDIADHYVECTIYPFSFSEFSLAYQQFFPELPHRDIFTKFLKLGGIPYLEHLQFLEEPSSLYLTDLNYSIVLKNIVKRNNIRDIDLLELIIFYVMVHVGITFSARSLSNYFKSKGRIVATETIVNYLKACENAFLFYRVKRTDLVDKRILSVGNKFYIADHGIRESILGGTTKDINLVLKNIVYMELLRRGYSITSGKIDEKEIDFIAIKQQQKKYIQVCYLLDSEEIIAREFDSFDGIYDHFPKYVFSLDNFNMSKKGIIHKNIITFLLEKV